MADLFDGALNFQTEAECTSKNMSHPFDWLTLGDSMGITDQNRTVVKMAEAESYVLGSGLIPIGTFATFGCRHHRPAISRSGALRTQQRAAKSCKEQRAAKRKEPSAHSKGLTGPECCLLIQAAPHHEMFIPD